MSKTKNSLEQYEIRGKVRSIETKTYCASRKLGEIKKGKLKEHSLSLYDEEGYMQSQYFRTSKFNMKVLYEFDTKKNILKETIFEKDVLDYEVIYKYDIKGNLIEELAVYPNDKSKIVTKYEYDSNGNLIKERITDSIDLDRENIYRYDNKGKEIEFYSFCNGELNTISTYRYDSKGNVIEIDYYDAEEKLIVTRKYEYDSKGDTTELVCLTNGRLVEKNISNVNRKVVEMYLSNSAGCLYLSLECKYNSFGNLIEKYSYDSNGNMSYKEMHEYELDKNNNWTKDIVLNSKRGINIIIRKIEYY